MTMATGQFQHDNPLRSLRDYVEESGFNALLQSCLTEVFSQMEVRLSTSYLSAMSLLDDELLPLQ